MVIAASDRDDGELASHGKVGRGVVSGTGVGVGVGVGDPTFTGSPPVSVWQVPVLSHAAGMVTV
jgi:hypothetical protein